MSYAIHAYAVDIKAIQKIYGSKNEALQNAIFDHRKLQLEKVVDLSYSDYQPEEALKDIFFGFLQMPQESDLYAYVSEIICAELGISLACSEWQDLNMNWIMDINMEAELPISELPMPVDFPYVLTIMNKDLSEFVEAMAALDIEEASARIQFETWIDTLNSDKKDLVLYFY